MNPDDPTIPPVTDDDDDLAPPLPDDDDEGQSTQPLPLDEDVPFSAPDDVADDGVQPDHPVTDTNIDETEAYNEGLGGAAEASDPIR